MAVKKIDGYEVPSFPTLAAAAHALLGIVIPDKGETAKLVSQTGVQGKAAQEGIDVEEVAEGALYEYHNLVHQRAASEGIGALTNKYTLPKSTAAALWAQANPDWFNTHLFGKHDQRIPRRVKKLKKLRGNKSRLQAGQEKVREERTATEEQKLQIFDNSPMKELLALGAFNSARKARGEKPLSLPEFRARQ
jgi:hypothetical protein